MFCWLTRAEAPHQLDDQALAGEVLDLCKSCQKFGFQGRDGLSLFVRNCRWCSREELRHRDVQSFCEPAEAFDAGEDAGMLNLVQTRLGDVGSVGELRLGEPVRNAQLTDLTADLFSNG